MTRSDDGRIDEPTREYPTSGDRPAPAQPGVAERPGADGGTDRGAGQSRGDEPVAAAPRRGRSGWWMFGALLVVLALVAGGQLARVFPRFGNPFADQRTDRSQPALLKAIQDLSRYVAAEGNFQVVIDLQKNRKYVPDVLLNQRTLFVGAGTVDAYVDFSGIAGDAVVESGDRRTVELRLPAPQLGTPNLDIDHSYVFAEQRGLLNKLGEVFSSDPNRQREVYQLAEQRIATAARDSALQARAQENTRKMLEGLLRSLGYTTVTVTFAPAL